MLRQKIRSDSLIAMGAGALSKEASSKPGTSTWLGPYLDWCPASVLGALERWRSATSMAGSVSRANWFEIFNDFTRIGKGGQFVSLPMEEFDRWNKLDKWGPGLRRPADAAAAPVRPPFVVLALLAVTDVEVQARVLFAIFEDDGKLEKKHILVKWLVFALDSLQLMKHEVAASTLRDDAAGGGFAIKDLVARVFGDHQQQALTYEDFSAAWHAKHNWLLRALLDGPVGDDAGKRTATTSSSQAVVKPRRQKTRQARAERRFGAVATLEARVEPLSNAVRRRRRSWSVMDPRASRECFRQHMKLVTKVASQRTLQDLMLATGLSYQTLSDLRHEFAASFANRTDTGGRQAISVGRLKSVLIARYPSLNDGRILTRLAKVFDKNADNSIDFEEFVLGLLKFMRPTQEQDLLRVVFALFDKNRDGSVDLAEICDLVETAKLDLLDMCAYARDKTTMLDLDGDGTISLLEFTKSLAADAPYRNFLWSSLPLLPPRLASTCLEPVVAAVAAGASAKGLEPVAALLQVLDDLRTDLLALNQHNKVIICDFDNFWHCISKIVNHAEAVDTPRVKEALEVIFAYFASDYFGNTPEQRKALGLRAAAKNAPSEQSDSTPTTTDANEDELVRIREEAAIERTVTLLTRGRSSTPVCNVRRPWAVVAKACCSTDADRAAMIFALMKDQLNMDERETITVDEIEAYLQEVRELAGSLTVNAVKLLDELDESGDGKLQMDELTSIVLDNPSCLHCMSALQICDLSLYELPSQCPPERQADDADRPMIISRSEPVLPQPLPTRRPPSPTSLGHLRSTASTDARNWRHSIS